MTLRNPRPSDEAPKQNGTPDAPSIEQVEKWMDEREGLHLKINELMQSSDTWTKAEAESGDRLMLDLSKIDLHIKQAQLQHNQVSLQAFKEANDKALKKSDNSEALGAFAYYALHGVGSPEAKTEYLEKFPTMAQTVDPNTAGGYSVDTTLADRIIATLKAFGGTSAFAYTEMTPTGENLHYPQMDAVAEVGELIGDENTEASEQDTAFGNVTFSAYRFSSKTTRISRTLLQDSKFNIEAWMRRQMIRRVARIENQYFTEGTGVNQPTGIVHSAAAGNTAASKDGIIWQDLVELEHEVELAYRQGYEGMSAGMDDGGFMAEGGGVLGFMLSDNALMKIKLDKDTQNRPIWLPPMLREGSLGMILGRPYIVNQDMDSLGDEGNKPVMFGNGSYFMIRRVRELTIQRFVEKYGTYDQIGLLGFCRSDSKPLGVLKNGKCQAYKALVLPA